MKAVQTGEALQGTVPLRFHNPGSVPLLIADPSIWFFGAW